MSRSPCTVPLILFTVKLTPGLDKTAKPLLARAPRPPVPARTLNCAPTPPVPPPAWSSLSPPPPPAPPNSRDPFPPVLPISLGLSLVPA